MTQAPERIWLQWEDHSGDNTWCDEPINDDDDEYIRADLHDDLLTALETTTGILSDIAAPDDDIVQLVIETANDVIAKAKGNRDGT